MFAVTPGAAAPIDMPLRRAARRGLVAPALLGVALLAACGGGGDSSGGAPGSGPFAALVSPTGAVPPLSVCPHGGTTIDVGVDTSGNGVLDPAEVTDTRYVCNGVPAAGVNWVSVSAAAQQAEPNTGYLASSDDQVVVTLPAAPAVGDIVQVTGVGAGGWKIAQNAGQSIVTSNLGGTGNIGLNWTARGPVAAWYGAASSADGSVLLGGANNSPIHVSLDGGATWTPRGPTGGWRAMASSADGRRLYASGVNDGIHASTDYGATWTQLTSTVEPWHLAASSDGAKLVAAGSDGWLYTSGDAGATWTQGGSFAGWVTVASSADGTRLVAGAIGAGGGQLATSSDSGVTWTTREATRSWRAVASSADGRRLVAAPSNGQIHVSDDFGVTWTPRGPTGLWTAITSSTDGRRLAAVADPGRIHVSSDFGVTWTTRESQSSWGAVASSANGARLIAGSADGQLVMSLPTPMSRSTPGAAGSLSGSQHDAVTLQYVGGGMFVVSSFAGALITE